MSETTETPTALDLKQAKEDAVRNLLRPHGNIVGIGIGKKERNGVEEDCLRFYVRKKIEKEDIGKLPSRDVLPGEILVPTAVIEVGRFGRRGHPGTPPVPPSVPKLRPGSRIRVKTNAPNVDEGARGTMGAVVADEDNRRYILGCNHLLAVNGRVPLGEADLVSAEFVGTESTIVGNMKYHYVKLHGGDNSVDCAMVCLPQPNHGLTTFADELRLSRDSSIIPDVGMPVTKYGGITGPTDGKIVDTQVDLYVDYGFGTFLFRDQVMIDGRNSDKPFAAAGDSGSLVVHADNKQAMAMIFAESGGFAVACRLDDVLPALARKAGVRKLELV